MDKKIIEKVMKAVPVGRANAKTAAEIADLAKLSRRGMGQRLNAISLKKSDDIAALGELKSRYNRVLTQHLWWKEVAEEEAATEDGDPKPLTLEEIVSAYLGLVMKHPEKQPQRVRDQEANRYTIHGFNRAQETLRDALKTHGATDEIKALGEIRQDGQQTPMDGPGGGKMWVVG